jgi:hypothetical protein
MASTFTRRAAFCHAASCAAAKKNLSPADAQFARAIKASAHLMQISSALPGRDVN